MKKFLLLAVCSFSAPALLAASTCVSRVDKNLDKSTAEKIDFCLTEEVDLTEETPVTEVIYSDTQSVQYPRPKTKRQQKSSNKQQTTKVYTTAPVSLEYFNREEYPAFRNDTLPSIHADSAHETALEALRGEKKSAQKATTRPKRTVKKQAKQKVAAPAAQSKPAQTPSAEVAQAQALQNNPLAQDNTADGTVPPDFLDDGVLGSDNFGYNATDPAFQP